MSRIAIALVWISCAAAVARADEIPIVTLTDAGPDQEVPTQRSFYVAGDVSPSVQNVQAIVVRRGSPSLFGDDGPECRALVAGMHLDLAAAAAAEDVDEDEAADDTRPLPPRYPAGMHRAFELFPRADREQRDAAVLVSAAWVRGDEGARRYKVLVPHDSDFFSAGYGYCMFVVASERAQLIEDATLIELIDAVARQFVDCGDRSSCTDDALADYETRVARALAGSRANGAPAAAKTLAPLLKEAARAELASATGIIEARDHLQDRWNDETNVISPLAEVVWTDTATDPFSHALATLLARSAALLPQVRGSSVALYTTDGKLQARAMQILEDGRSIRVAASKAPVGDQARVLTATTDTLAIGEGLTLYDLIELGQGRVHVDKDWIALSSLGERLAGLGLETWTAEDAAYLNAAAAQLRRLSDYVDGATFGATCPHKSLETSEADQTADSVRRHFGEWLVCQHVDERKLEALSDQLDELVHADREWKTTRDLLVARSKRMVTLRTATPLATRVEFTSRTWAFSYVTPTVGVASVIRPDESFGLFYVGAQIHLDPNPVDDVLWHDGVTTKDLRRAVALELGVAPYTSSFGPDHRYDGPGGLPPIFAGVALHIIPYTSFTFGGAFVDRKMSTLPQETAHVIFTPYLGFTLQLNVPDLIRTVSHPSSDTTASR
jgi:hypothetical protein